MKIPFVFASQPRTSHIDHVTDGSLDTWEEHNGWKHRPHVAHSRIANLVAESRRHEYNIPMGYPATVHLFGGNHSPIFLESPRIHHDPLRQNLHHHHHHHHQHQQHNIMLHQLHLHHQPHQQPAPHQHHPATFFACDYQTLNNHVENHDFLNASDHYQSEAMIATRKRMLAREKEERYAREHNDFVEGFVKSAPHEVMTFEDDVYGKTKVKHAGDIREVLKDEILEIDKNPAKTLHGHKMPLVTFPKDDALPPVAGNVERRDTHMPRRNQPVPGDDDDDDDDDEIAGAKLRASQAKSHPQRRNGYGWRARS